MKYLLDTNIYIHLFRGKFNLIEKFQEINLDDCVISEITFPNCGHKKVENMPTNASQF
ncbi:hypothetical protein [uncultured Polaribacter sp.]|uniref:hypothetical protein n=1 Tax=uncultured Polaribacter sp. TaxID=174711 RepID=UPI002636703B|nr:hypothetical protein [uncultured Polaribacter sp.]